MCRMRIKEWSTTGSFRLCTGVKDGVMMESGSPAGRVGRCGSRKGLSNLV